MHGRALLLCASLVLCACSDNDYKSNPTNPPVPPVIETIAVSSTSNAPLLSRGDTRTVTAVVRNTDGSIVASPTIHWFSSAPAVATVTGNGTTAVVTAVDDGQTAIVAEIGAVAGSVGLNVHRRIVSMTLSALDSNVLAGESAQLFVVARDARSQAVPFSSSMFFATSNSNIIDVDETGIVTAKFSPFGPQTTTILASLATNDTVVTAQIQLGVRQLPAGTFDFASLLLAENVRPVAVQRPAQAVTYMLTAGASTSYRIVWSGLASPPTSAHIHGPSAENEVGDVLVDVPIVGLIGRSGKIVGAFAAADIKSIGGRPPISVDSLRALMRRGTAYVDLHTPAFPGGEVRGQVAGPFR